jgi:hypothetical protein
VRPRDDANRGANNRTEQNMESPEDIAKVVHEVAESCTNPDPAKRAEAIRRTSTALGLTADKHQIEVRAVWDIVQAMEHTAPYMEPAELKSPEETIFWDFVTEWDLLES